MKTSAARKEDGDIEVLDKPTASTVPANDGVNVADKPGDIAEKPEGDAEKPEQPEGGTAEQPEGGTAEKPEGEGNTEGDDENDEEDEEVVTIGPRGLVMVVADAIPAEFSLERRPARVRWGFSEMVPAGHVVVKAEDSTKAIATVTSLNSAHKDKLWRTRPVPGTPKNAKKGTYDIEVWRIH